MKCTYGHKLVGVISTSYGNVRRCYTHDILGFSDTSRITMQHQRINTACSGGKIFNVCDGFLLHTYKSHLIAAICTELHIDTPETPIEHDCNGWRQQPIQLSHTLCALRHPLILFTTYTIHFLHTAFLNSDLRLAIRFEGGQISRHWKWWLPI